MQLVWKLVIHAGMYRRLLVPLLLTAATALAQEPFTIGAILPLSGEGASLGTACQNGIELARTELPKEEASKLKVIYEDDVNLPRNTIAAFRKLHSLNHPGAFISLFSEPSKAVAPLADEIQIPLFTIASDPNVVRNRKFVVNMWPSGADEGALLFREATRRGYRRIACIGSPQDGLIEFRRGFNEANHGSIEVVLDEEYPLAARDFRTYLTKVRAAKDIDAVFVNLYFGQLGLFARQAREMGVQLPLMNVETFEDKNEVALSNGALVGQWYVTADDAAPEFLAAYRSKFPGASLYTAANCHDIILLAADALRKGIKKPEEMNSYLHSVRDFKGALGTFSATGGNSFSLATAVKVITKDGFQKSEGAAD